MILLQYWYSGGSNAIIHSLSWYSVSIYQAFRYSSGHTESRNHLQKTEETTLVVSLSGVKLLLNPWEYFDARQHLVYPPTINYSSSSEPERQKSSNSLKRLISKPLFPLLS